MLFINYPREPEGDMARRFVDLTRAETLADIARKLHFDKYLILAEPSNKPDLTKAVLSDVCEAVIAALYLDGKAETMAEGVKLAAQLIDSGAAVQTLEKLIEVSNRPEADA